MKPHAIAGILLAVALSPAQAQTSTPTPAPRFKPLTYETMNEAQLKAAKDQIGRAHV